MKTIQIAALVAGAGLLLSACASDGYYHHHDGYSISYDGYYDDAYGAFYDGYWGDDGGFYYTDAPGHAYQRDNGNHFRHEASTGFHTVQGHPHAGGAPHDGSGHGGDDHH